MERLTRRSTNGTGVYATPSGEPVEWENNRHNVLQKLAEYEDLEEQGRLLKLPCKVGDTIYAVGEIVKEYKVLSVSYHSNKPTNRSEVCIETLPVNGSRVVVAFYDKEFGKNVFLTKSEAEAKLKELRGGKNE
jgi:hypothetical protein|nr:MAG TPA: hypothetical protein [Caudoviricetes sp.]